MDAPYRPNAGRIPTPTDRLVEGHYRNGMHFGPVPANKRQWGPMPRVSPHDFDIVDWRPA